MLTMEQVAPHRLVPMKRATYHRLGELGEYQGRRVQLVFGSVIDMSPMGTPHRNAIRVLNRFFVELAPREFDVMVQLPLAVADDSEPEPDFAFVPRLVEADEEFVEAQLVVEVSDSSLKLDLGPKARLYAEANVPEYWVIDLAGHGTVVHRGPKGGKYRSVRRVPWSRSLTSSVIPQLSVRFDEVLGR